MKAPVNEALLAAGMPLPVDLDPSIAVDHSRSTQGKTFARLTESVVLAISYTHLDIEEDKPCSAGSGWLSFLQKPSQPVTTIKKVKIGIPIRGKVALDPYQGDSDDEDVVENSDIFFEEEPVYHIAEPEVTVEAK